MSNDQNSASRRRFLKVAAGTAGAAALAAMLPRMANAQALPHLSPSDPAAKALGYVEDTSKVDQAKYANHKATDNCANCKFFQGKPGDAYAGCQLFPGKAVNAKGWCSAHAPKA